MPGTRKLGKTTDQRMAMLRQQVTDFLDNGRMETTITRAKEIQPMAEKMITLGKKGDLAAYRQALSFITREDVVHKLFVDRLAVSGVDCYFSHMIRSFQIIRLQDCVLQCINCSICVSTVI